MTFSSKQETYANMWTEGKMQAEPLSEYINIYINVVWVRYSCNSQILIHPYLLYQLRYGTDSRWLRENNPCRPKSRNSFTSLLCCLGSSQWPLIHLSCLVCFTDSMKSLYVSIELKSINHRVIFKIKINNGLFHSQNAWLRWAYLWFPSCPEII